MEIDLDWEPGDPLYEIGPPYCAPMICIKEDYFGEHFNGEAARWTPELGWRCVD